MIMRLLQTDIEQVLKKMPAVAILGPRQVGKTTLAKAIAKNGKKQMLYLDMEKASDRNRLTDAHTYLEQQKDKCVILDEVQLMPELFSFLRPLIDEHRKPGRFILLGSASPALVKGASESLAGRIRYMELSPVGITELPKSVSVQKHWFRGGFPQALTQKTDRDGYEWIADLITSYVERDLNTLFSVTLSPVLIRNFWRMLAHSNGNVWNAEVFARSLGVTAPTILRYLDFLEGGFMVRRLQPWYVNAKKRMVKSAKVYIRDTGVLHYMLGVHSLNDLLGHPGSGASWEGYVTEQVYQYKAATADLFFYRTQAGAECDLVLVKGLTVLACIEIKLTNAPTVSKGFYSSVEDIKPKKKFIITPSSEDYPLKEGLLVTSLSAFIQKHLPGLK
ncbi:MAG: ATP-binding protein [Lacibacter sp.]